MQGGGDDADGGFDFVSTGREASGMGEGDHQTDGAVTAHAEHTDVVEKDHARGARWILRLDEQGANDHIGAARFIHNGGAVVIVVALEQGAPGGERAATEVGATLHDDARGLATGMRIDDLNPN